MYRVYYTDSDWYSTSSMFFTYELARKYVDLYSDKWERWMILDNENIIIERGGFDVSY